MKISLRQANLATIAYAEIFKFPLTPPELKRWFVFYDVSRKKDSAFILPQNARLVTVRQRRAAEVSGKMKVAKTMATLLKLVPTVKLVGVTGGLSMGNAEPADDIDFFLVAAKGALWISRLLATLVTEATGKRRRPGAKELKNTICLNMFMAEDHLKLPKKDQDLFSAHEVLQMLPLWERGGAYQKFLKANSWVEYFLPNAWKERMQNVKGKMKNENFILQLTIYLLHFLEYPTRALQLWYMQAHRTTEVVSETLIRFHPRDARVWVKQAFERRLRRFNIPLDKVFYIR